VQVDAHLRAGDGLWAIGDITGKGAFTHTAMYQAGIAVRDILGQEGPGADYRALPRVTFLDPEIGAVGLTEDGARHQGIHVVTGSAQVYAASNEPITEDGAIAPSSPYALSKLAQEQLALRSGTEQMEVIVVRPFNHTGPRQKPSFLAPGVARQIALIERGALEPVLKVGNLDPRRDLIDVRDAVRAYAALMNHGAPGTVYNVASGIPRPVRTIVEALVARARVPIRIEQDPSRFRPNDVPVLVGNAGRLKDATGWRPEIPFERMIGDLLDFWRKTATP
jgi:GDP-4-dehydro-6-deoxy-D-mannose reductase